MMSRTAPDEDGEMFDRSGKPSDYFPAPFANDNQARASNNGALPPDFSVIAKARAHGVDYLYGMLTGYTEAPATVEMMEGMYYNKYFPAIRSPWHRRSIRTLSTTQTVRR